MIRVGIAGLGFMGLVHYHAYQKTAGVEVAAICTRDPKKRAGDWRGIEGNFGPAGEMMDLAGVAVYETIEELCADGSLDLIDVTLPPALHAEATIHALEAGKHVFCEKPLAMSLEDCDRMRTAAKAADRHLLVGHVLPFFPEYAWALREIRSGKHGKLLGGSLKRVISDPKWLENFWSKTEVGGPLFDLHVHDAHFIRLAFGMPKRATSHGSLRDGLPEYWHTLLQFDDPQLTVHAEGGVIDQPGRPFLHGFEFRLERALLAFEFAVTNGAGSYHCRPTLMTNEGEVEEVALGDGDPMHAFAGELQQVVNVLNGEAEPDALDSQLARDAIAICQLELESFTS